MKLPALALLLLLSGCVSLPQTASDFEPIDKVSHIEPIIVGDSVPYTLEVPKAKTLVVAGKYQACFDEPGFKKLYQFRLEAEANSELAFAYRDIAIEIVEDRQQIINIARDLETVANERTHQALLKDQQLRAQEKKHRAELWINRLAIAVPLLAIIIF